MSSQESLHIVDKRQKWSKRTHDAR